MKAGKFIALTLLTALGLLALYNVFLLAARPEGGKGQNQRQQNIIAAQEYAQSFSQTPIVITGSSLTARLSNGMLPRDMYNLSFAGGSAFTGLDIILRAGRPREVWVELNFLQRESDNGLSRAAAFPHMGPLNAYLPALYEKYQPVTLLSALLSKSMKASAEKSKDLSAHDREMLLAKQLEDYEKMPDTAAIRRGIARLKDYEKQLKRKGIAMRVFLMPVHCKIAQSRTYREMRPMLYSAFPREQYHWLPPLQCADYIYNDGVHLNYAGTVQVARFMASQAAGTP